MAVYKVKRYEEHTRACVYEIEADSPFEACDKLDNADFFGDPVSDLCDEMHDYTYAEILSLRDKHPSKNIVCAACGYDEASGFCPQMHTS